MRTCPETGKVCYGTRHEALETRSHIRKRVKRSKAKRRVSERNPYLCIYCGGWHLTSTKPA